MTLQTRKLNLIQGVLGIKDTKVLTRMEGCLKEEVTKAYEKTLVPMSMDKYIAMIERSREDVRAGRVVSVESVRKEMAEW